MRNIIFIMVISFSFLSLEGCSRPEPELPGYDNEVVEYQDEDSQVSALDLKDEQRTTAGRGNDARIKRSPFLTLDEAEYFEDERGEVIEYLNLSAIFHSKKGSYAVVDGRVIKEHDILDDKEVVSVAPGEVILKDKLERMYVIKLKKIVK